MHSAPENLHPYSAQSAWSVLIMILAKRDLLKTTGMFDMCCSPKVLRYQLYVINIMPNLFQIFHTRHRPYPWGWHPAVDYLQIPERLIVLRDYLVKGYEGIHTELEKGVSFIRMSQVNENLMNCSSYTCMERKSDCHHLPSMIIEYSLVKSSGPTLVTTFLCEIDCSSHWWLQSR